MTSPRAQPNLTTKLAAALLARGEIPYDNAKQMTAHQLISLYQWHHNIRHAEDGPLLFWNMEPILIAPHRKRTAEIDIPQIAKGKRIRRSAAEHSARLATKNLDDALETILQRPKRELQSTGRSFQTNRDGRWKKKISGEVVRR